MHDKGGESVDHIIPFSGLEHVLRVTRKIEFSLCLQTHDSDKPQMSKVGLGKGGLRLFICQICTCLLLHLIHIRIYLVSYLYSHYFLSHSLPPFPWLRASHHSFHSLTLNLYFFRTQATEELGLGFFPFIRSVANNTDLKQQNSCMWVKIKALGVYSKRLLPPRF